MAERHTGQPPEPARERRGKAGRSDRAHRRVPSRPSVSGSCKRSWPTSLPAARETRAAPTSPAEELRSASAIPVEQLDEHLGLLNLVNFGGGCYALYALDRGRPRPRRARALRRHLPTTAQADAARGTRDPARARVRRADDRGRGSHAARHRAPQARGDVRPVRAPGRGDEPVEAGVGRGGTRSARSPTRSRRHQVVEIEYVKVDGADSERADRAVRFRARAALVVRGSWDTREAQQELSPRSDAQA